MMQLMDKQKVLSDQLDSTSKISTSRYFSGLGPAEGRFGDRRR
jgi:hypothetical protein